MEQGRPEHAGNPVLRVGCPAIYGPCPISDAARPMD